MPLISVIIPVYNVEKYLKQCIESVINQPFNDMEIILVNDGSKDNSGAICDEYKLKDPRIKVIHKVNGGLSDARNKGIEQAVGKYLLFLDSDDYWMSNSLQDIAEKTTNNPDVVFLSVGKYYDKTNKLSEEFECLDGQFIRNKSQKEVLEYLSMSNKFPVAAWDKLVKRELIINNNLWFEKNLLSEDIEWTTNLLLLAQTYDVCETKFYVYRKQREGSITSITKLKNVTDMIWILDKWLNKCKHEDVDPELKELILALHAYEYTVLMGNYYLLKKEERETVKGDLRNLVELLDYAKSKKTKMVKNISKIMGINMTSNLLSIYIKINELRG